MNKDGAEVYSITDAPQRHSEEQHARMVRYALSQGLRMVCFILAGVTAMAWQSWWSMVFVAAAVVLPYVAVVDANAGGDRYTRSREAGEVDAQFRLTSSSAEKPSEEQQWWEDDADDVRSDGEAVIEGEVVRDDDADSR